MIHYSLIIILFLAFINYSVSQDCPSDSLVINSQLELDLFKVDYPNCNKINSAIIISGASDLRPLMNIDTIHQGLTITDCPDLVSLEGLNSLKYIGYSLKILNNEELLDLEALNKLQSTGKEKGIQQAGDCSIRISGNKNLEVLSGFNDLMDVGSGTKGICITDNDALIELSGFNSIEFSRGLAIMSNQNLKVISGFNSLNEVNQFSTNSSFNDLNSFTLSNNDLLSDISGLTQLNRVGALRINSCPGLMELPFEDKLLVDVKITITNSGLESLSNIECSERLFSAIIKNMSLLKDIEAFRNTKTISQALTLESLPSVTDLSGLRNLELVGRFQILNMDGITSMAGLGKLSIVTQYLNIENNQNLFSLEGFNSIDSVGGVVLANFRPIQVINNDKLKSLSGLRTLNYLYAGLRVDDNDILEDVSVFESVNFGRFISNSTGPSDIIASFRDNLLLRTCDYLYICNGLENENFTLIGNDSLCIASSIKDQCNQFSSINVQYFLDDNGNGVREDNEIYYYDSSVEIVPTNLTYYITEPIGPRLFLDEGEYNIIPQIDQARWIVTSSTDNIEVNSGEHHIVEIGITARINEIKILKNLALATRCNTNQLLYIELKNEGTVNIDGVLWLSNYPINFQEKLELQADTIAEDSVGFYFSSLAPSYNFRKAIELEIQGPPEAEVGDRIFISVDADLMQNDYVDSPYLFDRIIRCSWDPNDKVVSPNRNGSQIIEDDKLVYTIRFQNTGNDYAEHVTIIDTLDQNLDLKTFKLLSTSHPEKLIATISENVLYLDFPHIFLPDSITDNSRSQGFVKFSVMPDFNSIEELEKIENNADIYFDLNPPIRTNTVESIYTNILNSQKVIEPSESLFVYPNPTTSYLRFSYPVSGNCSVHNSQGNIVLKSELLNSNGFDLLNLPKGIYFLKINNSSKDLLFKIVLR